MRLKFKGRKKIGIARLQDEDKMHVSFSKRRNGLVKLANEFSILTRAEISLLVFSPGNRVYLFGALDANTIIKRYENQTNGSIPTTNSSNLDILAQISNKAKQQDLNSKLLFLEIEIKTLKRREKLLDQLMKKRKIMNINEDKDKNNARDESMSLENQLKGLNLNKLEYVLESAKSLENDIERKIQKKIHAFPQRKIYYMSEDVPSIFDLFCVSSSTDKATTTNVDSKAVGTAGVVRFAGPSRIING